VNDNEEKSTVLSGQLCVPPLLDPFFLRACHFPQNAQNHHHTTTTKPPAPQPPALFFRPPRPLSLLIPASHLSTLLRPFLALHSTQKKQLS
jgi:hypothetical protein